MTVVLRLSIACLKEMYSLIPWKQNCRLIAWTLGTDDEDNYTVMVINHLYLPPQHAWRTSFHWFPCTRFWSLHKLLQSDMCARIGLFSFLYCTHGISHNLLVDESRSILRCIMDSVEAPIIKTIQLWWSIHRSIISTLQLSMLEGIISMFKVILLHKTSSFSNGIWTCLPKSRIHDFSHMLHLSERGRIFD